MSFQDEFISFLHAREVTFHENNCCIELTDKELIFQLHEINPNALKMPDCVAFNHVVHVWEDLWQHKRTVMESRIMSLLGKTKRIHARKTSLAKLVKPQLLTFLEENHLNVPVTGKHKYGLMYKEELVAVALFTASCPVHRNGIVYNSHELVRFCNKNNVTVVGGLSKLIKHFSKAHHPDDIMSYADLDWSVGKSYTRLGFKKIGELPPQPFYVAPGTLERYYKINVPEEKLHLMAFQNQGSAKYLLDLKQQANG